MDNNRTPSESSTISVLIVDDDVDAATGVKELIEMEGHTVAMAHDGQGAIKAAVMLNPDVALIDLRLKGEWGLDVVQTLRGQFPDIVSVIMTGESDSSTVIKALRQGVYDYLTKPFQPDQMIGVIDRAAEKIRLQLERQKMMDELAAARDTAELASKTKTEFLSRLSGELGSQFSKIVKLASVISDQQLGPIENNDYVRCAAGISDGCRRLTRIMLWIGELGHLEAGSMGVNNQTFRLNETIQEVVGIFQGMAAAKQVTIKVNCSQDLPALNSDAEHFSRILGHLVLNAVKFSKPQGTVEVSAMVDGFGDLRINVSDNGVGISKGKLPLALAPFGQLGNNPEPDAYGVGLGLPLSDKFTRLLGGRMQVESSEETGTTIQLRFSGDILDQNGFAASA
jgi:signal transduction histidine kinase